MKHHVHIYIIFSVYIEINSKILIKYVMLKTNIMRFKILGRNIKRLK
jgi:hypothetical protein